VIIESVRVQRFRSIYDETLACDRLTALIGPNGVGKSSFLRAIEMFYTPAAQYTQEDFYSGDTALPITITISFTRLAPNENELFENYVESGTLTVEKELSWPLQRTSQRYFGARLQNPEFDGFRKAATGQDRKSAYQHISAKPKYSSLPGYSNQDTAIRDLRLWEEGHPGDCRRKRDNGQFFGFEEVGEAHLERFTRFLFVPAVRDASKDSVEGRGSILSELMNIVVRSILSGREDISNLQKETQSRYLEILDPKRLPELQSLEADLTSTLRAFVQDASVELTWTKDQEIEIPLPRAFARLVEDGYPSEVSNTGHGLQRAFVLSMLQQLAFVESQSETADNARSTSSSVRADLAVSSLPNLILGIEEPELYQHPSRQRHISKVLQELVTGGVDREAKQTQVIFSTHAPLFIDLERFDQLRILSKVRMEENKPKITKVASTSLEEIARVLESADGKAAGTYSGEALRPRLQALMTPWMNEGFFAKLVVLVEGEEDRAIVLGMARAMGYDFESLGISVIPCMGKNNIDRPIAIFSRLNIPTYGIWDSDFGAQDARPQDNNRLLNLFGSPPEDWPERTTNHFACFKFTMEKRLSLDIGQEAFERLLRDVCCNFSFGKPDFGRKNPALIQELIQLARNEGRSSPAIQNVIQRIRELYATLK